MSDLAHRFALRAVGCVCGSEWNWYADACSSIVPIPATRPIDDERAALEHYDSGFFECRRGHAFCARH